MNHPHWVGTAYPAGSYTGQQPDTAVHNGRAGQRDVAYEGQT
jgi:hypothetical protein